MKLRRLSIFVVIFAGATLLFHTSILLFFVILYSPESDFRTKPITYQLTEISSFSDQHPRTEFGFSEIPKELSQEEFISFTNPQTKSSFVISHLGGKEFECSGSCFCSSRRTASLPVLSRSLTILLSAFSATMVTKIAQKTFHDQCLQMAEDSGTCNVEDVETSIDSCNEKEHFKEFSWICKGRCVPPRQKLKMKEVKRPFASFSGNTKEKKLLKSFFNNWYKIAKTSDCEGLIITSSVTSEMSLEEAKKEFVETKMRKFCEESSSVGKLVQGVFDTDTKRFWGDGYEDVDPEHKKRVVKVYDFLLSTNIPICFVGDEDQSYPNVNCR